MTIKTPAQIFINGRFYCLAKEVEIKQNDPRFKKSLLPDNMKMDPRQFTGVVINIKRPPTTAKERKEVKEALKVEPYDEFFKRMVDAKDNPEAHIPVDLDV